MPMKKELGAITLQILGKVRPVIYCPHYLLDTINFYEFFDLVILERERERERERGGG